MIDFRPKKNVLKFIGVFGSEKHFSFTGFPPAVNLNLSPIKDCKEKDMKRSILMLVFVIVFLLGTGSLVVG